MKKCPICVEEIEGEAKKCIHCGEWISEDSEKSSHFCFFVRFWAFVNHARFFACIVYCIAGVVCLGLFWNIKEPILSDYKAYLPQIYWCLGWGAIGIAAGLWNSRNAKGGILDRWWHYGPYFIFVLAIATLAAFIVFGMYNNDPVRSYAAATLAGVVAGFLGDGLIEKFSVLMK
jgi:hypothetical protein